MCVEALGRTVDRVKIQAHFLHIICSMRHTRLAHVLINYSVFTGLLLYSRLTGANGISSLVEARANPCIDYLQSHQIEQYFYKPGMSIEISGKTKDIFLEKGPWGKPIITMRIQNEDEAREISQALLREMNAFMKSTISLTFNSGNIQAGDLFSGDISELGAAFLLPQDQGPKALEIALGTNYKDPEMVPAFFAAMSGMFRIHHNRNHCPSCFDFDKTTMDGRRNWGIAGFYFWNKNLSVDARVGMSLISGPDYRSYLPRLRGVQAPQPNSPELEMIPSLYTLNAAIMKDGRIPQKATLYRAIKDQRFTEIWEKLNNAHSEVDISDAAFAFASLDEEFVEMWLRDVLRGDGVILEIQASAGLPAGYVDRGTYKDHAEIVLPMNAPLFATRAFVDAKGRKRLQVEYRKFPGTH